MKNTRAAILFYFALFLGLFFLALNFNYVEGDDAATILHHLCGRNPDIQQPYAAYNSGLDFMLECSGLQREEDLRVLAVSVSFVSGFLILSLLAVLLESLLENTVSANRRKWFYFLLPLLLPDVLFHSLIVNSSNISFVFLLVSLVFFVRYLKKGQWAMLGLSVLAFAVCVPLRWTMLIALPLYAGLFFYKHPPRNYTRPTWLLLGRVLLSSVVAAVLALLLIGLTGYDLSDMRRTVVSATGYMEESEVSVLSMLAGASAFLTPGVLLLLLLAIVRGFADGWRNTALRSILGFLVCSAAPFVLLGFFPLYKYSMTLLPALLVVLCYGWQWCAQRQSTRYLFIAAVFVPWAAGVQIEAEGTFCGPGFGLNTDKVTSRADARGNNPDARVKIHRIRPAFDSGFYMPMPEGPRPLYGYFYVFFGGQWDRQVTLFTRERDRMFDFLALHPQALYFQDYKAYFLCDLYRRGYATTTDYIPGPNGAYRIFAKGRDRIIVHKVPDGAKKAWIENFFKATSQWVVYRSAYSNDILRLQLENSPNINILGPFTAIKQ